MLCLPSLFIKFLTNYQLSFYVAFGKNNWWYFPAAGIFVIMKIFFRLFKESVAFAIQALVVNKMRTFLSLLGVTIGIFAIISVFTMVDSMKNNVESSIASLGENVVFVQKWPWTFGSDYPWWKYIKRPVPSIWELEQIDERVESAAASTFVFEVVKTVEHDITAIENARIVSASHDYELVRNLNIVAGRYFTHRESLVGDAVCIVGADIAMGLFGPVNPLGRQLEVVGRKLTIIGILKKEGESMVGATADNMVLVPINYARTIVDVRNRNLDPRIMVRAKEGVSNAQLIDELTGVMRSLRKLKPLEEENFALNETSMLSDGLQDMFSAINVAGWVIGLFSILVGGFGIANIMFVSVKERTNIIGIQKALGAKRAFILFQFLSEAVTLCLIGGGAGLVIILLGTLFLQAVADMEVALSLGNVFWGIGISASIGLVSGIVPAWSAASLDPVVAIRSN